MRALGPRRTFARKAGTATTEAALVMIPLVFFLMLSPGIWTLWVNEQHARVEAHRDMFDKTTTLVLLPEAFPVPPVASHFGTISASQRRHAFATFPPSLATLRPVAPSSVLSLMSAPSTAKLTMGPHQVEAFPDGFPNQFVEGWKYQPVEFMGGWWKGDVELMRYGAVVRSPWTWLGWPFVPTQDLIIEPFMVQSWFGSNEVDSDVKKRLRLIGAD
jgi:hypothetical protein